MPHDNLLLKPLISKLQNRCFFHKVKINSTFRTIEQLNINSTQQGKKCPQEFSIYVFRFPSILPYFGFLLTVHCYNGWFVSLLTHVFISWIGPALNEE